MKRIWFGAVLLVVLLVLGIGSSMFMERTHLAQAEDLTRAAELAQEGNWNGAENFVGAARREWDKRQLLIAALCSHEPVDQIEGLFAQLEIYAAARDVVSYSGTCVFLAQQLTALGKSHSFSLENFF